MKVSLKKEKASEELITSDLEEFMCINSVKSKNKKFSAFFHFETSQAV